METTAIPQRGDAIAVIGGGLIGTSWSALFMAHGYDVVLQDPAEAAWPAVPERIATAMGQIAELAPDLPATGQFRLTAHLEDAVAQAAWVQENAPENVPLKQTIYAAVEAAAPAGITIASSTSSLVWSELSAAMAEPARLITAHPFNPPHLMPLVELFGPDHARLDAAAAFYRGLGRHPIFLQRAAVGHIANRRPRRFGARR